MTNKGESSKKNGFFVSAFRFLSDFGQPSKVKIINGSSAKVHITHTGIKADSMSLLTNESLTRQASAIGKVVNR